jgi:hypothetical protein
MMNNQILILPSNAKRRLKLVSVIIAVAYFWIPILWNVDALRWLFDWVDYTGDLFIISGGIYEGTSTFLTGAIWIYAIQAVATWAFQIVLHQFFSLCYIGVRTVRG